MRNTFIHLLTGTKMVNKQFVVTAYVNICKNPTSWKHTTWKHLHAH